MIEAQLGEPPQLVIPRGSRQHPRTRPPGQLDRRDPRPARARVHQHGLAPLKPPELEQRIIGGAERHRHARSLIGRQTGRDRPARILRRHPQLRVRPIRTAGHHPVPGTEPGDSTADRQDSACARVPDYLRSDGCLRSTRRLASGAQNLPRPRLTARPVQRVATLDADRLDPHQHPAAGQLRVRDLFVPEHLRASRRVIHRGLHDSTARTNALISFPPAMSGPHTRRTGAQFIDLLRGRHAAPAQKCQEMIVAADKRRRPGGEFRVAGRVHPRAFQVAEAGACDQLGQRREPGWRRRRHGPVPAAQPRPAGSGRTGQGHRIEVIRKDPHSFLPSSPEPQPYLPSPNTQALAPRSPRGRNRDKGLSARPGGSASPSMMTGRNRTAAAFREPRSCSGRAPSGSTRMPDSAVCATAQLVS
jgi:hypothetical protein